jgi:hypothetical protein
MKKFFALCSVLVITVVCSAWSLHGEPATACPYGALLGDGCPGSPTVGPNTFIASNCFTTFFRQSGQLPYSVRPSWNVAGCDYPVGIDESIILKDPNTIATSTVPFCAWNSRNETVVCQNDGGAGINLSGYDFSLHNCVYVQINKTISGPVVIGSNKWIYASGGSCASVGIYKMIAIDGGSTVSFHNNYMNGCGLTSGVSRISECSSQWAGNVNLVTIASGVTGAKAFTYNAFINPPARDIADASHGDLLQEYNYSEQVGDAAAHGETAVVDFPNVSTATAPVTMANWTEKYTTFLQPSTALGSGTTAPISTYEGAPGIVLAQVTGSISGSTWTVTACLVPKGCTIPMPAIQNGMALLGAGVTPGTIICNNVICAQSGSGTGGLGTYSINNSQTVPSETMNATFSSIANVVIDHNTLIVNTHSGLPVSGTILAFSYIPHANVTITNNYMDPTGAFSCANTFSFGTIGTLRISGNVDLRNGSNINSWYSPQTTPLSCYGVYRARRHLAPSFRLVGRPYADRRR